MNSAAGDVKRPFGRSDILLDITVLSREVVRLVGNFMQAAKAARRNGIILCGKDSVTPIPESLDHAIDG